MTYQFQPPATIELPRTKARAHRDDRFWGHIRRGKIGSSVLKINGAYQVVNYPSQDQIASASAVYLGGHIYEVDYDEAVDLYAAGFTIPGFSPTYTSLDWNDVATRYTDWNDLAATASDWEHI